MNEVFLLQDFVNFKINCRHWDGEALWVPSTIGDDLIAVARRVRRQLRRLKKPSAGSIPPPRY